MKLVLAVLLLILLLLQVRLWSGAGSLADINRLGHEIGVQQSDNALLYDRNETLRREVNDLKNGMDSIEERARSKLGLVRKGETFILIVDKDQADSSTVARESAGFLPEQRADDFADDFLDDFLDESLVETLPPSLSDDVPEADPATVDPAP